MKSNIIFLMMLFIITVAVDTLFIGKLYAQSDPSREILVYFASGIQHAPEEQPAVINSAEIQRILRRFNIDQSQVISAFPNFNEADTLKQLDNGRIISLPNMKRIFKILIPSNISREEVIDSLKKLPSVIFAEPNGIAAPQVVPNDQYFSYQWALQPGDGTGKIHAPDAWDIYTGSSNGIIGIIDWGVDGTHPDLSGKVSGDAPTTEYHGTHVAGIAAAKTNNTTGIAGVNWNVQLLSKNIETSDDAGVYQKVVDAVNYSSNVNVLNNSWVLVQSQSDLRPRYSTTVRMAFAYAYKQNRVAVCANGNYQQSYPNQTYYPAGFGQGIIAIGATNANDQVWNSSQVNDAIDVSAPGVSIYSTYRNPDYQYLSGTSYAAPHVSGIASLLKGYNSNLSNDDIENIIKLSADDVNSGTYPGWDQYLGYGRVNAKKALDLIRSPNVVRQWTASGGSSVGNTGYYTMVFYSTPGLSTGIYIVKRYEVRKTVNFGQVFQSSPHVWGRGVGTNGYSAANPNFGMGWCDMVSHNNSSATLKTYVYKVWTIAGTYVGWIPTSPSNVTWNYTVLGKLVPLSVIITGPTYLSSGETGTFTANPSGGSGTYTNYQWWYRNDEEIIEPFAANSVIPLAPPPGTWIYLSQYTGDQTITYGPSFDFSLKCIVTDSDGNTATDIHSVIVGGIAKGVAQHTPVAAIEAIPEQLTLIGNYPNPFNPTTSIKFGLPDVMPVEISIYSITGKKVSTLINQELTAGYYEVNWDGTDKNGNKVASGIYIYTLKAGSKRLTSKMLFAK